MIIIPETEYELTAIRAQGAGGQNVNKVSSAIHLRFDIAASSLSDWLKAFLLVICDPRLITKPYGKRIWQSLPPFRRTKELADVEAFFDIKIV